MTKLTRKRDKIYFDMTMAFLINNAKLSIADIIAGDRSFLKFRTMMWRFLIFTGFYKCRIRFHPSIVGKYAKHIHDMKKKGMEMGWEHYNRYLKLCWVSWRSGSLSCKLLYLKYLLLGLFIGEERIKQHYKDL